MSRLAQVEQQLKSAQAQIGEKVRASCPLCTSLKTFRVAQNVCHILHLFDCVVLVPVIVNQYSSNNWLKDVY